MAEVRITAPPPAGPWHLLIHQVPAQPGYNRVRVWRRLQRIGAIQIKSSVWGRPATAEALEDFQWLADEIRSLGGEALICEATFLSALPPEIASAFTGAAVEPETRRAGGASGARVPGGGSGEEFLGRVWVTRRGVQSDRIGSAWLIKRHIDPRAAFRFVDEKEYAPEPGELRFDMFEAEFSHEGDACTFEVLASRFVPGDAAVAAIAEIVHDIDLKDTRFARPETEGFRMLLLGGVCRLAVPDDERLDRGFGLFDLLWTALGSGSAPIHPPS